MKQRITYLLPSGTGIDVSDIGLHNEDIEYRRAGDAVEERRITIDLSQLPPELRSLLHGLHELHVRVVSHENDRTISPAVSRLPSGLHAFFTPRTPSIQSRLCALVHDILGDRGKRCSKPSDFFSRPSILSERFATSSTYQFYHSQLSPLTLYQFVEGHACASGADNPSLKALCGLLTNTLVATYVDVDFDAISNAVTVTTVWPPPRPETGTLPRKAAGKLAPADRLEVGILQPEKALEPEELSLGGYLAIVGEDDKPSATLFSFPSRHHPLPDGDSTFFSASFRHPTGLHPTLVLSLPKQTLRQPNPTCALHAYWTVPSALFIDRYQLSDPLFLASQKLVSLRAISGEQDLEAPDWAISGWGSAALLELAHPTTTTTFSATSNEEDWTITIPTHLRYINATTASSSGASSVRIAWPVVFWACEAEEGLKMATNPFDRVNLGYDGLFGPKTMFYHIPPDPSAHILSEKILVPVVDTESSQWVTLGTMTAVLAGFAWVCWKLIGEGNAAEAKIGRAKVQ